MKKKKLKKRLELLEQKVNNFREGKLLSVGAVQRSNQEAREIDTRFSVLEQQIIEIGNLARVTKSIDLTGLEASIEITDEQLKKLEQTVTEHGHRFVHLADMASVAKVENQVEKLEQTQQAMAKATDQHFMVLGRKLGSQVQKLEQASNITKT